jgi:hypothetical protein
MLQEAKTTICGSKENAIKEDDGGFCGLFYCHCRE